MIGVWAWFIFLFALAINDLGWWYFFSLLFCFTCLQIVRKKVEKGKKEKGKKDNS